MQVEDPSRTGDHSLMNIGLTLPEQIAIGRRSNRAGLAMFTAVLASLTMPAGHDQSFLADQSGTA